MSLVLTGVFCHSSQSSDRSDLIALALQVTQGIAYSGAAPAALNIPKSATDPPCLFPLGGERGMGSSWFTSMIYMVRGPGKNQP